MSRVGIVVYLFLFKYTFFFWMNTFGLQSQINYMLCKDKDYIHRGDSDHGCLIPTLYS